MARQSRTPPASRVPTPEQMKAAIPRLRRRIEEMRALDPTKLARRGDPQFDAIADRANQLLSELYGAETPDYWRFFVAFDTASVSFGGATPLREIQDGYREGISDGVEKMSSL